MVAQRAIPAAARGSPGCCWQPQNWLNLGRSAPSSPHCSLLCCQQHAGTGPTPPALLRGFAFGEGAARTTWVREPRAPLPPALEPAPDLRGERGCPCHGSAPGSAFCSAAANTNTAHVPQTRASPRSAGVASKPTAALGPADTGTCWGRGGTRGFPTPWCHGTCQPPHPKAAPPGQPRGTLLAKTSTAVRSGRLQAERTPVIPANPSQGWGWEVKQVRLNISQLPARSRLSLRRAAVNYSRQAPSSAQPCAHPQRLAGWLIKGEPPAPAPAVLGSFQPAPLAGDESSSWDRSHPIPAPRAGGRGCCVPLRSSPRSPRASGTAPRGRAAAPSAAPLGPPGWVRLRTAGRLSPGPSRI